ncbi:MAG: glycosyltransferase family 4 protein [Nanoarchaeota archaeon]|nr:glycosyltransferase family 4 protein [Nanoarchaeota archaeon]
MMKIYFAADIEQRKFEGRTQTTLALKEFLEKKGVMFVENPYDADIIHFHSSGIIDSWKAAQWKKKYGKPVVYTLYSVSKTEPFNHFWNHVLQNVYLRPRKTNVILSYSAILPLRWRGYKLQELDAVIVPSNFVKKRLFDNTRLIRIGINTTYFTPAAEKKTEEKADSKTIKVGYFGHPSIYKGVLDFAKASKSFPPHYESHIHVTELTPKIIKTFQTINHQLKIKGLLDDMKKAYHDMDIIVLPYRSYLGAIANPLVLLEAMSCGKAIVTTDFEYITEITQDAAIIVKPYSPSSIVKAVQTLDDPQLRKKMSEKARKIICTHFQQEQSFQEYFKLYQELLNNK